jgi:hypothetical protein
MKKLVVITALLFVIQILKGQDSIRRYEFGSTLITFQSFNTTCLFAPNRPPYELMNGLFFRYNMKRVSLRAHSSYSEYATAYASPPEWMDAISGDVSSKDFRIGLGVQLTVLKKKEWLYTFADMSYRNVFATGHEYGGFSGANDSYSKTSNGIDNFIGFGFKLKTCRNIFISPELGYIISGMKVNHRATSLTTGKTTRTSYTNIDATTLVKLHLTAKF